MPEPEQRSLCLLSGVILKTVLGVRVYHQHFMERNQEIVSNLSSKRQYSGLSPGGLSLWYVFSAFEQIVIKIKSLEHREAE